SRTRPGRERSRQPPTATPRRSAPPWTSARPATTAVCDRSCPSRPSLIPAHANRPSRARRRRGCHALALANTSTRTRRVTRLTGGSGLMSSAPHENEEESERSLGQEGGAQEEARGEERGAEEGGRTEGDGQGGDGIAPARHLHAAPGPGRRLGSLPLSAPVGD